MCAVIFGINRASAKEGCRRPNMRLSICVFESVHCVQPNNKGEPPPPPNSTLAPHPPLAQCTPHHITSTTTPKHTSFVCGYHVMPSNSRGALGGVRASPIAVAPVHGAHVEEGCAAHPVLAQVVRGVLEATEPGARCIRAVRPTRGDGGSGSTNTSARGRVGA
jgi:hypothetical protein